VKARPKISTKISASVPHAIKLNRSSSQNELLDISDKKRGAFSEAVNHSMRGARIVYHIGEFCAGPHRNDAREAYDAGRVLLTVQKRMALEFAYIAIVL
jgi:hypothetical protein